MRGTARFGCHCVVAAACAASWASPAQGQRAGTSVVNVASAASADAAASRVASNPATLRLDEVLDIGLTTPLSGLRLPVGGTGALPFVLVNRGNGNEAFVVSTGLTDVDGVVDGLALDLDGNGVFDPAIDRLLGQAETTTDLLAPGAMLALLLVVSPTRIGARGHVTIAARARTGFGRPASLLPGRGDDGTDAIVGATSAAASIELDVAPGTNPAPIASEPAATLAKSQSVLAPDGTSQPIHGALVTYTLVASFAGSGAAPAAMVSDAIPDRTSYVAGSLMLDGAVLSDAADGDAGSFTGSRVEVALGTVRAPATHNVRFQVKIK